MRLLLLSVLILSVACGDDGISPPPDAGFDGGDLDAGPADAGVDAGLLDAGDARDAGAMDAGPTDAGFDAGFDAGPPPVLGPFAMLAAANADIEDRFGFMVDTDGIRVVVAALGEDSGAAGMPDDNSVESAGAVYVFRQEAATWIQEAMLKAPAPDRIDSFGHGIAIEGDVLAIGANFEDSANGDPANESGDDVGAVYIFRLAGGVWTQEAFLQASNADDGDEFGYELSLSGNTLVVGAPKEEGDGSSPSNDDAYLAGAAYVFEYDGGTWNETAYLKASNAHSLHDFAQNVDIDGDRIVIGATRDAPDGSMLSGAGGAYVFERQGDGSWTETARLHSDNPAANHWFGHAVSVSGDTILIGTYRDDSSSRGIDQPWNMDATNSGAAHVFRLVDGSWVLEAYIKSRNSDRGDGFGTWVDLDGDTVVVGALSEQSADPATPDDNSMNNAGAAYLYRRSPAGEWSEVGYLKHPAPDASDHFGRCVALRDGLVVVGARYDDSSARGIDGDPSDDTAEDSGAAFLFNFP